MPARTRRASRAAPPLTREAVLASLFARLFTSDEFRRWLGGDPVRNAILEKLPGSTATPAELFDAAVGAMSRAGFVDSELFERLVHDFPLRIAEICETATAWPASDHKTTPTTPRMGTARSPGRTRGGVSIGDDARVTVGGHLVGGDLILDGSPGATSEPRRGGRKL